MPAAAADTDAGAERLIVQVRDVGALDAVPGGVRSQRAVGLAGTHVLEVAASRSDAVRAALARHPDVVYVEADAQVHAFGRTPNDPLWEDQWGARRIEAPAAWTHGTGTETTTVAVLDTGVNPHEDLDGALLTGWNTIDGTADVTDRDGHGTAVAGVAAARGDNGTGIAGICWSCKVSPSRCWTTRDPATTPPSPRASPGRPIRAPTSST